MKNKKLYPKINTVPGVLISTGYCGLQKNSKKDLVIIQCVLVVILFNKPQNAWIS